MNCCCNLWCARLLGTACWYFPLDFSSWVFWNEFINRLVFVSVSVSVFACAPRFFFILVAERRNFLLPYSDWRACIRIQPPVIHPSNCVSAAGINVVVVVLFSTTAKKKQKNKQNKTKKKEKKKSPPPLTLVCLSVPNPRRRRRRHNSCSATPSAIFGILPPPRHPLPPPPIEFWTLPHPSLSEWSKAESKEWGEKARETYLFCFGFRTPCFTLLFFFFFFFFFFCCCCCCCCCCSCCCCCCVFLCVCLPYFVFLFFGGLSFIFRLLLESLWIYYGIMGTRCLGFYYDISGGALGVSLEIGGRFTNLVGCYGLNCIFPSFLSLSLPPSVLSTSPLRPEWFFFVVCVCVRGRGIESRNCWIVEIRSIELLDIEDFFWNCIGF